MKKILFVLFLILIGCNNTNNQNAKESDIKNEIKATAPLAKTENNFNKGTNMNSLQAKLETTKGNILVELEFEKTPMTVANFVGLAEGNIDNDAKPLGTPYFDGIIFHRVIKDFMIQGGDPNTKNPDKSTWGQGGPGYNLKAEFNSRSHLRGIVSMARAADPDSAGSQFFIVTSDSTFLDKQYTVFGEVVDGMEVADKIVDLPRDGNDCPKQEAKMLEVTISE